MNDQNDARSARADRQVVPAVRRRFTDGNEEVSNLRDKPVQNSSCNCLVSLDTSLITAVPAINRQRSANRGR
jgi:hypothetical protein